MDDDAPAAPLGDRQCKATAKSTGKRCNRIAHPGCEVCVKHGAGAPQVRKAAARKVQQQAAVRAVATLGLPIEVDPLDALLGELWRTAGHVAWLGAVVADLDGTVTGMAGGLLEPSMFGLQPSAWLKLYQQERRHLADVARACLAAGVEERRVRIAEGQAELIAQAFRGFAVELGHDPADPAVREAFRRHLTLVQG
jgi:hypothetical protein